MNPFPIRSRIPASHASRRESSRSLSTVGLVTQAIRTLDRKTWKAVLGSLRKAGLLRAAPLLTLQSGTSFESELGRLYETIEDSPLPETEWKPMRDVLGDDMLTKLLGISRPSVSPLRNP